MPALPGIQPLIISAPFGNYIQPRGATPTLGTFTAANRPGRIRRIIATVRYYPRLGAWVNKIGLRNPGIDWLASRVRDKRIDPADKLLSIHGFTPDDWWKLLDTAAALPARPLALELNMSCPNVGHADWPAPLFSRALETGIPVIVKLPPVDERLLAEHALAAGIRAFHCCNTLPVPAGGLSGKPLKPVALQCIRALRALAQSAYLENDLTIIGGGGITVPQDIDDYIAPGVAAHHIAIGAKAFNPLLLLTDAPLRPLIDHAHQRLRPRPDAPALPGDLLGDSGAGLGIG